MISILRRTKDRCHFYLLTASFTDVNPNYLAFCPKKAERLNQLAKTFNTNNFFKIINCRKIYDKHCSDLIYRKNWATPYAILRTLIFDIPELTGKIIYLDSDTMVNGDLGEFYSFDLEGADLAMAHELTWFCKYGKRYYNNGVTLIDIDQVRKTKSFENVIKFVKEKRPILFEQDGTNYCCKIKCFPNHKRFNRMGDGIKKDTIVKHFWRNIRLNPKHRGIRQWEVEKVQNVLKIHNWDEDYKIYKKLKEEWGF